MVIEFIALVLLAATTGILGGMLGIGGNVIAIPILFRIFEGLFHFPPSIAMHMTIGTSIVTVLFTLLVSAYTHLKRKNIQWKLYFKVTPFLIVGALLGSNALKFVNETVLKHLFALFLISLTIFFIVSAKRKKLKADEVKDWHLIKLGTAAILIGFLAGLLGIGGGILLIPLFLHLNHKSHHVTGTVSACAATTILVSSVSILLSSLKVTTNIPYAIGFTYLPAIAIMLPIILVSVRYGVTLSVKLKPEHLKMCLSALLLCLSISLFI